MCCSCKGSVNHSFITFIYSFVLSFVHSFFTLTIVAHRLINFCHTSRFDLRTSQCAVYTLCVYITVFSRGRLTLPFTNRQRRVALICVSEPTRLTPRRARHRDDGERGRVAESAINPKSLQLTSNNLTYICCLSSNRKIIAIDLPDNTNIVQTNNARVQLPSAAGRARFVSASRDRRVFRLY